MECPRGRLPSQEIQLTTAINTVCLRDQQHNPEIPPTTTINMECPRGRLQLSGPLPSSRYGLMEDKYKFNSITAQLKLDLPNHTDEEHTKYIDLLEIMLDDHMISELEVNGGRENFTRFIETYADRLLEWKNR
jgi:hypothetical protein